MFERFMFAGIFVVFGAILTSICVVLLYRVKVSGLNEKGTLISCGWRLIFYSGFLLVSLHGIYYIITQPSITDVTCDMLREAKRYNAFFEANCMTSLWVSVPRKLFLDIISALQWFIPLSFAATGANVFAHGLLLPKGESEAPEDAWYQRQRSPLSKWLTFLSRQLK